MGVSPECADQAHGQVRAGKDGKCPMRALHCTPVLLATCLQLHPLCCCGAPLKVPRA